MTLADLRHLHLSGGARLHGARAERPAEDGRRQFFPEHLAEKHVDERVQAHVGGREPQGGFLGDVERVLRSAGGRHAARLREGVRDADEVVRGEADEEHADHDEDLGLGPAAGGFGAAPRRFVWLIDLLADERVADHHHKQGSPEYHLQTDNIRQSSTPTDVLYFTYFRPQKKKK